MKDNQSAKLPSILLLLLISSFQSVRADEPFTGWKKTETNHFIFIFEEQNRNFVEQIAGFSDEVYEDLTRFLDSYPRRIRCVVSGRIDRANGYFSSFPAHMNLFLTAPTIPWLGSNHKSWLKVLFIHELTHYIHLTYEKGFFHLLSYLFGSEIRASDTIFLPGWMIEGITVVNETLFSEGGRGRNPFFEIVYKAHIMEDEFFSLRKASYSSPYPPRGRIYIAGYLLVSYMMEQFGKDIFTEIHKKFVSFPLIGPRHAIKKATGMTALEIFNNMKRELQSAYERDKSIPGGSRITPRVVGDYYSPRQTERGIYLYRSTLDKGPAIVFFNPDTGKEEVLVETALTDYTSFSSTRDGSQILFSAGRSTNQHPAGYTYISHVYQWDLETRKISKVSSAGGIWQPSLSPDGSFAAAVEGNGPYSRLVSIDRATGKTEAIFEKPESMVYNPRFSPDGRRICFALHKKGDQTIWIFDRIRQEAFQITGKNNGKDGSSGHYFPRFADNDTVIYTTTSEGRLTINSIHVPSASVSEVCSDPVGAFGGEVVDQKIIYSSYSSQGYILKEKQYSPVQLQTADRNGAAVEPVSKSASESASKPADEKTAEQAHIPSEKVKPYIDFPAPLFWLPVPFYINTISSPGPVFGLGAYAYGRSVLGHAEWQAAVTTRTDIFQLGADISASVRLYPFTLTYSLAQAFLPIPDNAYYQITDQSLGISLPLFSYSLFSAQHDLRITTGFQHRFRFMDTAPFPFFGLGTNKTFYTDNLVSLYGGVSFETRKNRTPRDLHIPLRFKTAVTGSAPLPVGPPAREGFTLKGVMSATIPSFFNHQAIKLGLKADYTSPALLSSTTPVNSTVPRGMFAPELKQYEGRVLASIDYLFTIALLDAPLPLGYNMFGIHIQRIGGGLHFETVADWGVVDPLFSVDDYFYVGLELNMEVGAALGSIPIGSGFSFRFDRTLQQSPDLTRDFAFYFFIGTDSFQGTLSRDIPVRDN